MMAELMGKETGYCHGRGGSMHIVDVGLGILGANGIVGAGTQIAAGAGMSIKVRKTDQVVACFFGDDATSEGMFHESINLAAVWDLPVIFVCENNLYGQFTPYAKHTRVADIAEKAKGYGIPGVIVDGNDVMAVMAATEKARGLGNDADLHLKDLIRRCHLKLVEKQLRDAVTLLASGGIALAEHVAKAIICGVDGIIVDVPLLLSLECRMCKECASGQKNPCPIELENLNVKRGAQRMVNLVGAWNNQLLEILGAMGMREVRRLRGEVGRAMFKEDLDKEIFAPLFARPEGEARRVGE